MSIILTRKPKRRACATSKNRKALHDSIIALRASDFLDMEVNSSSPYDHPVCRAIERQHKVSGVMIIDLGTMFKTQYICINNIMYEIKGYYGRIEFMRDLKKAAGYGFTKVAVGKIELINGQYAW